MEREIKGTKIRTAIKKHVFQELCYIYSSILWVIQIDSEPAGREVYLDNKQSSGIHDL